MKALILVFLCLCEGARAACLSGSLSLETKNNFDLKPLEELVLNFESVIKNEMPSGHTLVINLQTLNPRVNAEILKNENEISIEILGGMLFHQKMKPDVLKLLLCHEVGHLLGGPPLKARNGWSSTEGQADYFSSSVCIKKLEISGESFLEAATTLASIYAEVSGEAEPHMDLCDERRVERTNFGYPSSQCRLDTLVAGWFGQMRPLCWFKD